MDARHTSMACVLEARNRIRLVQFTLDWIERVERHINDVSPPFTDIMDKKKVNPEHRICK
ncbi:hypothetical protein DVH05_005385 [Phytophthora capsici]|nr:hypothetical protein DVH05_005385 [Phytophthora capsici]